MNRIMLFLIGFRLSCAGLVLATEPPRLAESQFKDLEARWKEAMVGLDVPGVSFVVVKGDDVILLDGIGIRDPRTNAAVDADTMFYIASCTKPYTATGLVILQDEGKLKVADTVRKHLPRMKLADEELTEKLSLADLACHKLGINQGAIVFNDAFSGQITEDLYYRLLPQADIANKVNYSNLHFTLLGRVIEAASGKPWRDFLEQRLFLPAGMTRTTGYASRMYSDANTAFPLVREQGSWILSPNIKTDRTMHAAGGLGTTARDLGQWLRLNLNNGYVNGHQVVSPAGMKDLHQRHSDAPPRGKTAALDGFGLGWMIGNYRGRPMLAHGGGFIAASAYVTMLPEEKIGVAAMVNSSAPGAGMIELISGDVLDRILNMPPEKDLLPTSKKKAKQLIDARRERETSALPVTGERLSLSIDKYVGSYVHEDYGTVEVFLVGGRLQAKSGDFHLTLVSRGTDQLEVRTYPGDDGFSGAFEVAEGQVAAFRFAPTGGEAVRFERK